MEMERDAADEAASSLRLLDTHFRQRPVTKALCFINPDEPKPTQAAAPTPMNDRIVDHMVASIREIVDLTYDTAPKEPGPAPERPADFYRWCLDSTEGADEEARLRRDIVIQRQRMEHAIQMGEYKVVRPHPCPACRTWGLQWDRFRKAAVCLNRRCQDRNGMANTWTLARLATQHVVQQENRARRAT